MFIMSQTSTQTAAILERNRSIQMQTMTSSCTLRYKIKSKYNQQDTDIKDYNIKQHQYKFTVSDLTIKCWE